MRWLALLLAIVPSVALAQMDDPRGQPIQLSNLPTGSVAVRVIDGSFSSPMSGVDVVVESNTGKKLAARTNPEGRATISGLEPEIGYVAKVTLGETTLESEQFSIPPSGGLGILLSPSPVQMEGGGHGAAGAGGGDDAGGGGDDLPPIMRDPRKISGQARPEQGDPPGQLSVRLVQGAFKKTDAGIVSEFPPGAKVVLVGFSTGGKSTVQTKAVDAEGRAQFDGLRQYDSYYAMALLSRADGTVDRLVSEPIQMPPQVGARVILAGLARDSKEPAVDDVVEMGRQESAPAAGVVDVQVDAVADQAQELPRLGDIELYRVGQDKPIASLKAAAFSPTADDVMGQSGVLPQPNEGLKDGEVDFLVIRMATRSGLPGTTVEVKEAEVGSTAVPIALTTDERGFAVAANLVKGKKYVATAIVKGKQIDSEPFSLPEKGALSMAFAVDWPAETIKHARFTGVAHDPDAVFYVRAGFGKRELLSGPFQLTDDRGAGILLVIYPEIMFGFHGGGDVDDERVWFELKFSIANGGQRPIDTGENGLLMPLPKGFVGASVEDMMSAAVKIDADRGLIWKGPLPPGQKDFNVTFALPVEDGEIDFDMALPYGLRGGSIMLGEHPGVNFEGIPAGTQPKTKDLGDRSFKVFENISIAPNQRLVFRMTGLPQPPAWKAWLRLGAGLVVVGFLAWGGVGILIARRRAFALAAGGSAGARPVDLEKKRERLLDQLVQLETQKRKKKITDAHYEKTRDKLMKQLESVFEELGDSA